MSQNHDVISVCLKCGHDVSMHTIKIIGRYDFMEISCEVDGENYNENCGCDAGFHKVQIKKEFTQMER